MSKIEMWKWFKLPVSCELIPHGCLSKNDLVSFNESKVMTDHHVEKVEIAINSYDANQDLITKQAEQIKMLRNKLFIIVNSIAAMPENNDLSINAFFRKTSEACNEALEATKPVEE